MSTWTKTPPTESGDWKWKDQDDWESLVHVDAKLVAWGVAFPKGKPVGQMGGEWLRLIPADEVAARETKLRAEVEKAWREGNKAGWAMQCDSFEHSDSRARRIALGQEEPTL
jgi:hypothetical protein